ncbi:MAG: TonB-dependent receptor [Bryobacterales bacterium]|nr:TonB-dependent receptor [Bryobacterales bacterium]
MSPNSSSVFLLCQALLWLALAPLAQGQISTGALSGTVQDEQQGLIEGARVVLTDPAKGYRRNTVTNEVGAFTFTQLPASTYEMSVESTGFRTTRFESLTINADDQRSIRIELELAGQQESVTVMAEAPLVREAPAVATAVDQSFIENQPLNGRSFQGLLTLSPGVVLAAPSLPSQGQFSVNGQRTGSNYFTVDGVSANFGMPFATTPYEGSGGGTPSFSAQGSTASLASVDAVQEFTIQTSTYAPEYGRQPGGQVAIVTRSGTNDLHGSVFEYFRNDKLDANSWFGNYNGLARPTLRQNDFGFTVGGPAVLPKAYDGRNKTFFFVSYEGLRLIQPDVVSNRRVPSVEARQQATGVVKALLENYPLPTGPAFADAPLEAQYAASFSNPSELNSTAFRIDHSLGSKVTVFGRYSYAPSSNEQRARYAAASYVAELPGKTQTLTLGSTMILTPSVNNDLRVNYSRSRASQFYRQTEFGGAKLLPDDFLLPDFADPATSLLYIPIGAGDEQALSPGTFSDNFQNQLNFVDTLGWNAGAHTIKIGFDYRRLAPSIGGRLYSKVLTFPDITALATGVVPTGTVTQVDTFLEPRYHNFSAYFQDAWRFAPRLTLTYGLRWEVNPAPGEGNGNLPVSVVGLESPQTATLVRGEKFYETTWANFAPRLGLSWQPSERQGTVIRAGFGVFYDLGYSFTGNAFSPSNFPYARSVNVRNTALTDPVFTSQPVPPISQDPPYPRVFGYYDGFELPYTLQYSFAVEQPFARSNSLTVSYVGSAGRRLARAESLRTAVLQNPDFTRVDAVSNRAASDYNSLQTQFKRRLSKGFQALTAYTWSKSLDTASDESISNFSTPILRGDPNDDRGPSSFDIRHAFTGSLSYEIPAPNAGRAARAILGGFALDSVIRLNSAAPVNIVTGRDPLNIGLTNIARPDRVVSEPLYLEGDSIPGGKRFNPAAFDGATPLAQGRQGTLGRNVLRGFGVRQLDLSLRRRFQIFESAALNFRADAFNLFNTPNFADPSGVLTNSNFGVSTAILSSRLGGFGLNPLYQAGGPRSIQLGLKLEF